MSTLSVLFANIAEAIRNKTGDTATMKPAEFPAKIESINVGIDATILTDVPIELDFANGNQTVTAEDGTVIKSAIIQQPETLIPANIASGVTIAGVIGELVAGGGGSEAKNLTFVSGDFTPTTATMTVSHSLGCVPDMIIVCCTHGGYATSKLLLSVAFSDAAISAFGGSSPGVSALTSAATSALTLAQENGIESTTAPMSGIYSATKTSFMVGGSIWGLSTAGAYRYIAVSGMV